MMYAHFIILFFLDIYCCSNITNKDNAYNYNNVYLSPVHTKPYFSKFDIQYNETISRSTMFVFNFLETFKQNQAVRVHVSSKDADVDSPILFVVKEKQSVLSWQLPYVALDQMLYNNVSRTLCNNFENTTYTGILIEVSTMDIKNVTFLLRANLIDLDLKSDEVPVPINLTTSEPMHLRYTFGNETSVMVKVDSEDDHCLFFSIKQIQCPVEDSITNTQLFTGMSQTVSRKGSITVQRGQFRNDTFYVVLTLLPFDYECSGISTLRTIDENGDHRIKNLKLSISPNYSNIHKWFAVAAGLAAFLLIYLLSVFIICAYHCTMKIQKKNANISRSERSNHHSSDPYASNDESLISDLQPSDLIGVEHDDDIDLLRDAEGDKNIIRTKKHIYVSDLSMKPKKKKVPTATLR